MNTSAKFWQDTDLVQGTVKLLCSNIDQTEKCLNAYFSSFTIVSAQNWTVMILVYS